MNNNMQIDEFESNQYIFDLIKSSQPFSVIRGGYEFKPLYYLMHQFYVPSLYRQILRNNAGMYPPTHAQLYRFYKSYIPSLKTATGIVKWGWLQHEAYFLNRFCKSSVILSPRGLEPYYFDNPWSAALKGKKVLVIHPFEESIKEQYKNRHLLFMNKDVLPDFHLITYKSVQSITNLAPHKNWSESLKVMKDDIQKIDFDVAILGCGVYAPPLAHFIKDIGKGAVQIGGATQILFGIKGGRWDNHSEISKLYNPYWTRPHSHETPVKAKSIEGGCYW